ncbi:hypothetical protein IJG04_00360 [Candidatus Saccharibacteria bacterium]|nr:hypothetical protein [Candidatus Saccharibacteria bacterium]
MQRVADEFGAAVDHQCSPELLSIRFLSCAKKHSIWLQIELAGHFYLLQKLLADRLHEAITSRWVNVRPANIEALYLVFCLKMFSMLLVWAKYGCREAELSQYRSRLAALIKACDTGQTIVAVYS